MNIVGTTVWYNTYAWKNVNQMAMHEESCTLNLHYVSYIVVCWRKMIYWSIFGIYITIIDYETKEYDAEPNFRYLVNKTF